MEGGRLMNIDLARFCILLSEVQEDEFLDESGLSPYLMEHLFYPYMKGKNIPLDSLDYDAFELEDLDRLFDYLGDLETVYSKLQDKAEKIWKGSPIACRSRAFC
jgi:hypothetical protein